jgi:uncharacterized membrane protein YhiD involved in acid resistance
MGGLASTGSALVSVGEHLWVLLVAALLGAALGVLRPVRREIVPRSAHVIHAQILLAIVGALIIIVVAESLARAFAIVGAAGLVRYRARIDDPKDAGVMLVALAIGLTSGSGQLLFATAACLFVIAVLWVMESFEPESRSRFDLKISSRNSERLRPEIEHALNQKGISYELRGSSPVELRYEVTVPYEQKIRKLTKLIRSLDGHAHHGRSGRTASPSVEWEIKRYKTVRP